MSGPGGDRLPDGGAIVAELEVWARELGFSALAVASLDLDDDVTRFDAWLAQGRQGAVALGILALVPAEHLDPPGPREGPLRGLRGVFRPRIRLRHGPHRHMVAAGVLPIEGLAVR